MTCENKKAHEYLKYFTDDLNLTCHKDHDGYNKFYLIESNLKDILTIKQLLDNKEMTLAYNNMGYDFDKFDLLFIIEDHNFYVSLDLHFYINSFHEFVSQQLPEIKDHLDAALIAYMSESIESFDYLNEDFMISLQKILDIKNKLSILQ